MIAAQLPDGRTLKINFRYDRENLLLVGKNALATDRISCYIIEGPRDNETELAHGEAFCSIDDQFNKKTGRKIALQRAIAKFDRETQGALLQAYFSRHRSHVKPNQSTFTQGDSY